ncbi:MAG TPA: ABC transporter permease [Candidatus Limnocylindrales bacterium]|nr:ABC transporter permease [Candidatus Limnocylindrales bacterium]
MSLRRTMAITRRLLEQFRHDRRTLALLFVAPLVILGIFALLFTDSSEPARLGIGNRDTGAVGAALVEQLDGSDLVATSTGTDTELASALESGDLDAYLLLPADLTSGLSSGRLTMTLLLRGTDPAASAMVQRAIAQAVPGAIAALLPPGGPVSPTLDLRTRYLFGGPGLDTLDLLGGPFIGLVVFFLVYVVTSVSFLRERTLGTLERLMASPLRRSEIVLGYMAGFTLIALVQAVEVLVFSIWLLNLYNAGDLLLVFGIEVLLALGAINLGIFLSTFARSEFQAVQFIPLVITPQIMLSGVIVPVSAEPGWLQVVSNVLPLTYAVDGLRAVMLEGRGLESATLLLDLAVLGGFAVLMLLAASLTLRREVA